MSKVAVVKWAEPGVEDGLTSEQYSAMLAAGFEAFGKPDFLAKMLRRNRPDSIEKGLFSTPDSRADVVGIKTNCLTRRNATPIALAKALARALTGSGFDENNIIIWDRTCWELAQADYKINVSFSGTRCFGTDANGVGYSEEFYGSGPVNSLVSRILTEIVSHSINLPVLKDHWLAGVSAGMKNMYGAIHNPNKYHDNNCTPFCGHINHLEPVRDRHRLTIMDAVNVQYNGGPGYKGQYLSFYGGLIISEDPVACDRIGVEVVEHLRRRNRMPPLQAAGRPAKHIDAAAELGLGESNLEKIDLRVVDVDGTGSVSEGELLG
ncbi:MAG: DUF362 domain-containing protein [Candidatus Zixiibacteriota bacterium]|nr:MAG: DUF362 domain-containing protein [candidate division Zixibacteria bacterium]